MLDQITPRHFRHVLAAFLCALICSFFVVQTKPSMAKQQSAPAGVTVETVEYKGWQRNLKLSNGTAELIITLDVGPRVIRYGYVGGANVFKEFADQIGKSGEKEWMIRGGHRLWHAPEDLKRTYDLDNAPVEWKQLKDGSVRVTQKVEPLTGVQKEMDFTLDAEGAGVKVVHRLRNTNLWDVELSPWALTVMAPGGVEIIPLPPKTPHPQGLSPNQQMVIWPYTDLGDKRWTWGARYITLKQDARKGPTKIGLAHRLKWVAYLNGGVMFVKQFGYTEGRRYPDNGCNFETFTNQEFLEVESLGPLQRIAPGKSVEHGEQWWLLKEAGSDLSEAGIDANVKGKVEALLK